MKTVACHVHCEDCEFNYDGKNGMAIAGMHHNKTGHKIGVETISVHYFERGGKGK